MKRKVFVIITLISSLLLQARIADAGHIKKRKVKKLFKHSQLLNSHFTGFALYDLDNQKMIYEQNSDKYFTPASNTKLFTYYTCLKMLSDSIPALKYVIHGDSLIFWGTGDPSFLHSDLKNVKGFNFLKNSHKKLFFAAGNYTGDIYGNGWSWDDYNDYYQAEINELPIEDNVALLYADKNDSLQIKPAYLKRYLKCDSNYHPHSFRVKRDFVSNSFVYPATNIPKNFKQEIPWKTSTALTLALLQDTLKDTIRLINMPLATDAKTIYSEKADTVYKHMLQPSDNFMAEQLLLVCSSTKFKTLNTDSVINYSKTHFLNDLPDVPQWVDGSGLSRQNLFTPRSIVMLLRKILDEVKSDSLVHSLMPAGGVVGTIKKAYKTDNGQPFIWAKTGSLNNNYNQSGYFITRKGKRFAFSFMNNNFIQPDSQVRDEMVKLITYLHDNY
ncbi:D-alanyl-D-alanine carboxypeptidase [Mucilaginibacter sp. X4EP1]|uniref:D-alanyl-D-alanine carboxypeptidase n=1 Tax=Mucilaginibacter sp. X4EP1 TaxID=2723092 RepID=UPI0021688237|nr:D-alanyl-D-alanine carboxypeptidase [Mucilaginibacter sp. X4EP1]MCS3814465.1 D-alanyl-D-alanine carboxypeptidase/D-alanyl-D-alanine-endopeptidase (penicillin-binding protein 4) [Mucilaginibacter sp. X4EP1]